MTTAQTMMEDHDRKMEALTEHYIGKATLDHGRSIPDLFFKKQWYANRINDLGRWEGANSQRMRRCRSTESPLWKKGERIECELRQVKDHLILELIMLDHRPGTTQT
jgi:hypothetical protein